MLKRFISVSSALLLGITCLSSAVYAEETAPTKVYRTSVDGVESSLSYTATLEAYSDGRVHIEVQTVQAANYSYRIIGNYTFNDTYIQPYNEATDTKIQKSKESQTTNCYTTFKYDENDIIYTLSTLDSKSFTYATDLYVRDAYLNTTIPFSFFGKEIEIPFGSEALPTGDAELQNMITKLKADNEALTKQNTENATKIADLESKNKELETSVQNYETENGSLKSQNQALASSINKFDTENAALKATLAAIDSDSDDLLTAADAQAVLNYYVAHLAGKTTGKVSDYAEYSKQKG